MQFCLVSPATVTEFDREVAQTDAIRRLAEHAPVGVLTLAAVLEQHGRDPAIFDLNVFYYDYLQSPAYDDPNIDFCGFAAARLLESPFDVIGFGTICSTYPLTLRIADRVRRARPQVPIVFGGPQASAVDIATLQRFPQVDFILRYEAEDSLPALLNALEAGRAVETVAGLTYRRNRDVVRTPSAPVIDDLDCLPIPAYHRYPYLKQARFIPLELGRGCPYACTFCSTNDFFRRNFRLKTPQLIVEQMIALKRQYNVGLFDLIHDMFTVNRKKVVEFCETLIACEEKFTWNCSARTDRVDEDLLDLMAEAGCRGIFYGIETGSQTLQVTLKKRLILSDAMTKVRAASERGLQTAVSLITGFPTETEADFADTADFFTRALRYENTVPQLHILAPLADTPIEREYRDRLQFDDIISDMSHQGWDQDPADRDLIAAYPDVFVNFYAVPTPLDRPYVKEVRAFLLYGGRLFRWLMAALHHERRHILDVYADFRKWLEVRRPEYFAGHEDVTGYYRRPEFRTDFLDFVVATYAGPQGEAAALGALVEFSRAFDDLSVEDPKGDSEEVASDGRVIRKAFARDSIPMLADNVRLVNTEFDFLALMNAIVTGDTIASVPRTPKVLASRKLTGRWPQVLQLSPMSVALLELCDGARTVAQITAEFSRMFPRSDGVAPDKATLVGLELLRHDNLIKEATAGHATAMKAA